MREEARGGGADCTKIVLYGAGGSQTTEAALTLPVSFPHSTRELVDLSLTLFHKYYQTWG